MPKGNSLIVRLSAILLLATLGSCGQPGGGQPPAADEGAQGNPPQTTQSTAAPAPTGSTDDEQGSVPAAASGEATAPTATEAPSGEAAAPTPTAASGEGAAPTPTRGQPAPTAAAPVAPAATLPVPEVSVVPVPPAAGVTGEVPDSVVQTLVADLAGRLGVEPGAIAVASAEAVTWPDGSLGCPQPGMVYQQVLVEGYRVVLAVGDATYPYHGAGSGSFVLCERPRP